MVKRLQRFELDPRWTGMDIMSRASACLAKETAKNKLVGHGYTFFESKETRGDLPVSITLEAPWELTPKEDFFRFARGSTMETVYKATESSVERTILEGDVVPYHPEA